MKIALVHDYLVQYGGAERVLESFVRAFPTAPIYTLLYDERATHRAFAHCDVRTSFLQNIIGARRHHRLFPLLMPLAIESFDLSRFDVVLSDSSSFAKSVITRPETVHISYIHTPMRYAWDDCQKYTSDFGGMPSIVKRWVPFAMTRMRIWDRVGAMRVDHMIANSEFVSRRIHKYYRQNATVINPPVDISRFRLRRELYDAELARSGYILMVGRLIAYKRHDLAIRAANRLKFPLYIIGRGPEEARLRALAGPTVRFLSRIDDDELARYYANARAFVFPQEEDFGIVAIEAMAAGRPIIAFRGGDIAERLRTPEQGVFMEAQTVDALCDAIQRFESLQFNHEEIARAAEQFDKSVFERKIRGYVEDVMERRI